MSLTREPHQRADHDRLTGRRIADQICANGPIAVRMTKELARRGSEMSLQDGLRLYQEYSRLAHMTEDAAEGGRAFAQKRAAEFKNR